MSAIQNPVPAPVRAPEHPAPAAPVSPPPSRRRWLWAGGVVVAAVGAWWLTHTAGNQSTGAVVEVKTARVTNGPLLATRRVAGQTAAKSYANISAPSLRGPEARSLILVNLAPPGAMVRKGQIVAQIDPQAIQDHVDDIADTIRAAQSDVERRRAEQAIEWEDLQQTVRVAKAELDKARLEYGAAEIRTAIDRELLKLTLDEAEARYQQLQSDLANKKIAQAAELRVLQLTKERHQRHHDRHVADVQHLTMKAPMDGLSVRQSIFRGGEFAQIQTGDQVYPGMTFVKVVDPKSMILDAFINQSESSRFRIGQEATVHLDAFPGRQYRARVYSIGALAGGGWRQSFYIRTIPLRLTILDVDAQMIPDLSASADVVLDKIDRTLQVPRAAVQTENGKPFVWVKTADGYQKRTVETGSASTTQIAILSGLEQGEEVTLSAPPVPSK